VLPVRSSKKVGIDYPYFNSSNPAENGREAIEALNRWGLSRTKPRLEKPLQ